MKIAPIIERPESTTVVSTEEMARILDVTPNTLRTWFNQKKIPGFRASKQTIRFQVDEVLAMLRQAANENGA